MSKKSCNFAAITAAMEGLTQTERKNGGVTFTPEALADFLSEKLLHYYDLKGESPIIMDPA